MRRTDRIRLRLKNRDASGNETANNCQKEASAVFDSALYKSAEQIEERIAIMIYDGLLLNLRRIWRRVLALKDHCFGNPSCLCTMPY